MVDDPKLPWEPDVKVLGILRINMYLLCKIYVVDFDVLYLKANTYGCVGVVAEISIDFCVIPIGNVYTLLALLVGTVATSVSSVLIF